ncbi:MAG: DUF4399 domain-containing protein [Vicinamibacterales bacterium]
MKKTLLMLSALAVFGGAGLVAAQIAKVKSPEGAKVYIISPKNGDTVTSPFTVQFGLKGMGIAPAGMDHPNTGHHHLLIDVAQMPDMNAPMPATDNIKHFGMGQTEAEVTLPPGRHTLQLAFADYLHRAHDKPVLSEKITVTVK